MVQVEQQTMTLRIDGREITALRGATILEAATANGIYIPTLCYDERLKAYGACRMCLVTQDGRPGMPASCVTPAAPDASYRTNTDEVLEVRRSVLNLLMSEHPHGCLTCDRIVHCGPNDICLRNVSVTNRCVVCPQNQRCDLQATVEITGGSLGVWLVSSAGRHPLPGTEIPAGSYKIEAIFEEGHLSRAAGQVVLTAGATTRIECGTKIPKCLPR